MRAGTGRDTTEGALWSFRPGSPGVNVRYLRRSTRLGRKRSKKKIQALTEKFDPMLAGLVLVIACLFALFIFLSGCRGA